jgi:pimeloyl-ACP methyl ester carboxylesterase
MLRAPSTRLAPLLAAALLVLGCERPRDGVARATPRPPDLPHAPAPARAQQVVVEEFEVPGDLPAYVLRGASGSARMVFLHGMCGHGQGYVQAFQFAAARRGTVVALSGDHACGTDPAWRTWTQDVERIDARIRAAFDALGQPLAAGDGVVLIGMSQGALRAEVLAQRFPDRYTHAIFMGSPRPPRPAAVRRLRGAVVMAGEHEGTWVAARGAEALERVGVPASFIAIPGAQHAQLLDGERIMGEALDWLWANAREKPSPS